MRGGVFIRGSKISAAHNRGQFLKGYPPLQLPRELPNGSQNTQPWITRIAPNRGRLSLTMSAKNRERKTQIVLDNPY